MNKEVCVFVLVIVVNVVVGFDIFGFVIDGFGDEVVVWLVEGFGVWIISIFGDGGNLFLKVEKNMVGFVVIWLLEQLGKFGFGIELEIYKKMLFGSGLGLSVVSVVVGVMVINVLLDMFVFKMEFLYCVVFGE